MIRICTYYVRKVSWLESERNGEKLSAYCYTIKQAAILLQEALHVCHGQASILLISRGSFTHNAIRVFLLCIGFS